MKVYILSKLQPVITLFTRIIEEHGSINRTVYSDTLTRFAGKQPRKRRNIDQSIDEPS